MTTTSVFAPIFKSQEQDDGSLMIYGKATGSDLDLDHQRCDPEWLARAVPEWFKIGNIREQHDSRRAVGKATEHEVKPDGHYIKAHIVDPVAIAKTKAGVFTGLSIGISSPRLEKTADEEWIRDGRISEVSLCDRPCLPTATFTMCKTAQAGMQIAAVDFDEERGLVRVGELVEKTDEPEVRKSPSPLDMPGAKRPVKDAWAEVGKAVAEVGYELHFDPSKLSKADDVARLGDPAPGQVCGNCGEEGHLECVELADGTDVDKASDFAAEAHTNAMSGGSGCGCCTDCMCTPGGMDEPAGKADGFDKAAAVELVKKTLSKAEDEQPDIDGADQAIACIAQLIANEAMGLADNPEWESCDISLLLDAVRSLCCFKGREQMEQTMADAMVMLADTADLLKEKYSAEQKRQMLKDGKAIRNAKGDPSFPIGDKEDLDDAIHAVGRSGISHSSVIAYIKRRAKALGATDMLPEDWTKTVDITDVQKAVAEAVVEAKKQILDELAKTAVTDTPEIVDEVVKSTDEAPAEELPEGGAETAVDKAEEPTVGKAAADDETYQDALAKAFAAVLDKADSPLNRKFEAIQVSTESTAKSVNELTERLEKVESMATPNGPALRRTISEEKAARIGELTRRLAQYKALAENMKDPDARAGYRDMMAPLEAEISALQ